MSRKAVVLVSGGLDSATTLALARQEGYAVHAISFRYGQRHELELQCARKVCQALGAVEHQLVELDLRPFGGSALTAEIPVPKGRSLQEMGSGIPVTYVPARNTIFLSFALAYAETRGTGDIFLGVNALDYSGYPDCRPEYIAAFERMANLATKGGVEGNLPVRIHAPLIHWSKEEIIRRGLELQVDYGLTTSCYDPDNEGRACGQCDACLLRRKGFQANGLEDPITYQTPMP